jgi:hypothetical protein
MRTALLLSLILLGGCATFETRATKERKNANRLIDCVYRAAAAKNLTRSEIAELRVGCYALWRMRDMGLK